MEKKRWAVTFIISLLSCSNVSAPNLMRRFFFPKPKCKILKKFFFVTWHFMSQLRFTHWWRQMTKAYLSGDFVSEIRVGKNSRDTDSHSRLWEDKLAGKVLLDLKRKICHRSLCVPLFSYLPERKWKILIKIERDVRNVTPKSTGVEKTFPPNGCGFKWYNAATFSIFSRSSGDSSWIVFPAFAEP